VECVSVVNSASYYEKITDQGSAIFNSLVGTHVFDNGNKRTASQFITEFAAQNNLSLSLDAKGLEKLSTEIADGVKFTAEELSTLLFKNE